MYIEAVMLEITRKCNLKCGHCLRGAAQNKSMSNEVMYAAMSKGEINSLSFGGGEPALAAEQIKNAAFIARHKRNVESFFLVTNGRYAPPEFIDALREMYISANNNEMTALCYSDDQYHDLKPKESVLAKIKNVAVEFKMDVFEEEQWLYPKTHGRGIPETIIMGRSRYGNLLKTAHQKFYFEDDFVEIGGEPSITEGLFYINVDGDVFPSCDLSYKAQKNPLYKIGNVRDPYFNYYTAAIEWNRRVDEGIVGEYFHD